MDQPSWYKKWRHDAFHELVEKNADLNVRFRLDALPRYDYDLENARLIFSDQGKPVVTASIQMVGTTVTGESGFGHGPTVGPLNWQSRTQKLQGVLAKRMVLGN